MTAVPVAPVQALSLSSIVSPLPAQPVAAPQATGAIPFSNLLTSGIDKVSTDQINADAMVRSFATDDSVPLHQVTFALEQARLSLELAMQVRSRLLEGYQQIMNMQL